MFLDDGSERGVHVFPGGGPYDNVERRFRDIAKWPLRASKRAPDRVRRRRGALESGTPYRFRFEVDVAERTVRVYGGPFDQWENAARTPLAWWKAPNARAWQAVVGPRFRFASLVRFRLREVVITGKRAGR